MTALVVGPQSSGRHGVMLRDNVPALFSIGALVWSGIAVIVTQPFASICSRHATAGHPMSLAIAVLVVAVYAKCLFGAAGDGAKRVVLGPDGSFRRPLRLRLLDLFTTIVGAATDKFAYVVVVIPILALVISVGASWGWWSAQMLGTTSAAVFVAGLLLLLGRIGKMLVAARALTNGSDDARIGPWGTAFPYFAAVAALVSYAMTSSFLDRAFAQCGIASGAYPSVIALLSGLVAIPLIHTLGVGLTAAAAFLSNRE